MYHPPQRAVGTQCFTISRWVGGTFHLPKLHGFDDHLRKVRCFFPLTDVDLGAGALPFLALRASAIHAVAPTVREEELLLSPVPDATPRGVSCYLENLAVHGTLELLPGLRTSDFLGHQEGFIVMRGCRLVPPAPGVAEPVPVVFVNARAIVAVAEEQPQGEPGGRVDAEAAVPA